MSIIRNSHQLAYTDTFSFMMKAINCRLHNGENPIFAEKEQQRSESESVACDGGAEAEYVATRPGGQEVKTSPFHGGNTGSIPVRVIIRSFSSVG